MFTFPALTTDEAATLKQLVGDSNPIVKTAMKRIKLRERDGWQSGKYDVSRVFPSSHPGPKTLTVRHTRTVPPRAELYRRPRTR